MLQSAADVEVTIGGDATAFVNAIQTAGRNLANFEEGIRKASVKAATFGSSGGALGIAAKGSAALGGALQNVAGHLVTYARNAALAGVATATAFGTGAMVAGLGRLEAIQDATVSLTKMLGSEEKAAKLTAQALQVVKGTPFAFPDFAQAARQLVAYGMAAEKVPGILQAIADSAAASGQGQAAVQGITYAFSQMQAAGKLNMGLINQISGYGVSAIGILANAYGKSTADMQKFISAGHVSAAKGLQVLQDGIEKGSDGIAGHFNALKGSAQDLGKTISGSLGNVKAAFARMGASWLKPFEHDLPDVLNKGVIPLLDKLGEKGHAAMQKLADTGITSKITGWLEKVPGLLDQGIGKLQAFKQWLEPLLPTFKNLKDAAQPFIALLGNFGSLAGPVRTSLQQLSDAVQTSIGPITQLVQTTVNGMIPALVRLAGALTPLIPALSQLSAAFVTGFVTMLTAAGNALNAMAPALTLFATLISGLPAPLLAVGVAMGALLKVGITVPLMLKGIETGLTLVQGALMATAIKAEAMGAVGKAVSGASLAMGSMLEAVTPGGLLLLGLGALAAAFVVLGQSTDDLKAKWQGVVGTVDQYTGAINDATRASVAKQMVDDGSLKQGKALGLSSKTLINAALGQKDAVKEVTAALKAKHDADFKDMENMRGSRAGANAGAAAQEKYKSETQKVTDALFGASGALADQRATIAAANEANSEGTKQQKAFAAAITAAATAATASKDAFNGNTAAGAANLTTLKSLQTQGDQVIGVMKTQGASSAELTAQRVKEASGLEQVAAKMSGNAKAAVAYVFSLKGVPASIRTDILSNAIKTKTDLDQLQSVINAFPKATQYMIYENAIKAGANIDIFKGIIGKLPKSAQVIMLENAAKAGQNVSGYHELISHLPREARLAIYEDALEHKGKIKTYADAINALPKSERLQLLQDAAKAGIDVSKYHGIIKGIPESWWTKFGVRTDEAKAAIKALQDKINGIQGKTVTVHVHQDGSAAFSDAKESGRGKANGGIVEAYASGGVRDGMMARGGRNILWAEPETGWEAYISGKAGASTRNKAVWMEAGKRLGMLGQGGSGGGANVTLNVTQQEAGDSWMDAAVHKLRFALG